MLLRCFLLLGLAAAPAFTADQQFKMPQPLSPASGPTDFTNPGALDRAVKSGLAERMLNSSDLPVPKSDSKFFSGRVTAEPSNACSVPLLEARLSPGVDFKMRRLKPGPPVDQMAKPAPLPACKDWFAERGKPAK
jgi:hypothetical protein